MSWVMQNGSYPYLDGVETITEAFTKAGSANIWQCSDYAGMRQIRGNVCIRVLCQCREAAHDPVSWNGSAVECHSKGQPVAYTCAGGSRDLCGRNGDDMTEIPCGNAGIFVAN